MPQIGAALLGRRMQLGAISARVVLLRGRDNVAQSLRRGESDRYWMSPMSTPVAQDRIGRSGEPDEASNLAALLPIGSDLKARVRILIVDDEHTLRESCASVLRQEGYGVTVSGRGQEALDLLKRRAFDIVLADLYLPQVGGLALLRAALATNRDTIVIVMTGNPSVDSSVEALRQGAFDYLPKPFSATHLQVLIGRAVHTLLESEMFGHRKGAFTGAVRDKPGLLEAANGGTLFLDELIEMSKPIQAKLLRVIQDGVVRRVGSEATDAVVNVRFIAATNGDPETAVKAGDMREDLYYRLRVVPIHVPPLRERPADIPLLAEYFLSTYWVRHRSKGAPFPKLTEAALRALCAYAWRGNVRELQNVIEHVAVVVEPGAAIQPEDLHLAGDAAAPAGANPASLISTLLEESYHVARDRVIAQFERQYLTWLVNRAAGNMSKAARVAGVDRTTLYRMMERHGLQRSPTAGWVVERDVETPAEAEAGEPEPSALAVAKEA